jgi:hypothetical protein
VYIASNGGNVLLLVERSAFESNKCWAAVGLAAGAGLMMEITNKATYITTTIAHCTFSSNTAQTEVVGATAVGAALNFGFHAAIAGGLRTTILNSTFYANRLDSPYLCNGGAIRLAWSIAAAAAPLTTILDSTFEANRADGSIGSYGGAVDLDLLGSGAVQTIINRSRFLDNAATGYYGYGGAIHYSAQQTGTSLHMLGCTIRGNKASQYGAGISAKQVNPNPPANLKMVVTYDPLSLPHYQCASRFTNTFAREYICSSELVIDSCDISNNHAVSKYGPSLKANGGALHAVMNTRTISSPYAFI